jgi:hypothetical protein
LEFHRLHEQNAQDFRMNTATLPKSITVIGRRWFRRGPGNTDHTAEIIVDGETVHRTPIQYGYGDQYADTAYQWLLNSGIVPKPVREDVHWRHIRNDLGISYTYRAIDVQRQKDL